MRTSLILADLKKRKIITENRKRFLSLKCNDKVKQINLPHFVAHFEKFEAISQQILQQNQRIAKKTTKIPKRKAIVKANFYTYRKLNM